VPGMLLGAASRQIRPALTRTRRIWPTSRSSTQARLQWASRLFAPRRPGHGGRRHGLAKKCPAGAKSFIQPSGPAFSAWSNVSRRL